MQSRMRQRTVHAADRPLGCITGAEITSRDPKRRVSELWDPVFSHPHGEWSLVKISGDLIWGMRGGEEEEAEREKMDKNRFYPSTHSIATNQTITQISTTPCHLHLLTCLPGAKSPWDATYSTCAMLTASTERPVSLQPRL